MTAALLSPHTLSRLDKKCGKSGIEEGKKCRKPTTPNLLPVVAGLGLAAGYIAYREATKPKAADPIKPINIPREPPKPSTSVSQTTQELRQRSQELTRRLIERNQNRTQRTSTVPTAETSKVELERKYARELEGATDTGYNAKHNYIYGTTPEGKWVGYSETPGKQSIGVFRTGSGWLTFQVNNSYNKNITNNEGKLILSRVERMLQKSIADLPDNMKIWASAEDGDGFNNKREKLYKRYGFKPSANDPWMLFTTVKELKARSRRNDSLTLLRLRLDKKCGKSGIADNKKCTKTTAATPTSAPQSSVVPDNLKPLLAVAGLSTATYLAARARYRAGVTSSAADAMRRSRSVDTSMKARQKRIVFCVPGVSGSETIQMGQGMQAAWQKGLSPEKNKKDEKTIQVDTRKANIDVRESTDANAQEIIALHLKNQLRGRNEVAVDLAAQIIAHRKAHPDKQIVITGHSYGGAIAEEALAIVSRTKTPTKNIINISFGTNNYSLLDGMHNKDIQHVNFGGPGDPFTTSGPTKNLRNISTIKGHSLRDYSSNSQVKAAVRNLLENRAPIMKRDSLRIDKRCGASHIPDGAKCHKGGSWPAAATIGAALTAGGIAAYAISRRTSPDKPTSAPAPESGPPRLPGLTPRGLLRPAPPRKSKTQRMRENTSAAVKSAEQRIGQTAREEVRRVAQIGNTMAITGEATGMAAKTTLRELRLRAEAARRKWEPGYRRPDQRRLPGAIQAQLPESGAQVERIPVNPRTGQPRRRKPQGFGR